MATIVVPDESYLLEVASVPANGSTLKFHAAAANIQKEQSAKLVNGVASFSNGCATANGGHVTEVKIPPITLKQSFICCWTVVALIVFAVAWKITTGGYKCSLLLSSSLSVYAYSGVTYWRSGHILKQVFYTVKQNVPYIIETERRPLTLLLAYVITKFGLSIFRPELEKSNGSAASLILFTVYFIMIFILPTLVQATWKGILHVVSCHLRQLRITSYDLFNVILRWRMTIFVTVVTVILSYIFDGDLTCVLRYIGHGKSCWPLLVPKSLQDNLPYPVQHAWFKKWHVVFSNYKPPRFVKETIIFGREMEVVHVLPMLIGTYVLSLILLPKKNWVIKKVLFGCISSVVLSGVTSGALKVLLHRYRPNAYGNPFMWTGPGTATVNHLSFSKLDLSFPCGHTTVSTSIAACVYIGVIMTYSPHLKMKLFLIVCIYICPIIVFISRVSECNHWTSDAIFGIFLGQAIGYAVMSRLVLTKQTNIRAMRNQIQQIL